jgi:guanylate kinase
MTEGLLVVLSGPSGSGKSSIIKTVQEQYGQFLPEFYFSVSATTRPPRTGEENGRQYHFVDMKTFEQWRADNELLEWAEFAGNYYGTPLAPVKEHLRRGEVVLLDIETKGAMQIKKTMPQAMLVFVIPEYLPDLEKRLRARGTENEAAIARRMELAKRELQAISEYHYIIYNNDNSLDKAAFELASVIVHDRCRIARGRHLRIRE